MNVKNGLFVVVLLVLAVVTTLWLAPDAEPKKKSLTLEERVEQLESFKRDSLIPSVNTINTGLTNFAEAQIKWNMQVDSSLTNSVFQIKRN